MTHWFKTGKGIRQGCILSLCLFNFYTKYIMQNAGLDETQAGIKIAGRTINNFRYADDTTLTVESEEEVKGLLMEVKEESEKAGLKLNIHKTKIMAWSHHFMENRRGKNRSSDIFFSWAPKSLQMVTAVMKLRWLLLEKTVMTNLDSVVKSRDITLPAKIHIVKVVVISSSHLQMWELKNWCFQTVVLEKTVESPLDYKEIKPVHPKGNQPWIFIGRIDFWSWSFNTLATWCEEPTHWKRPWCWERLRAGGEEGNRGWDGWMASLTQWTWVWTNSGR